MNNNQVQDTNKDINKDTNKDTNLKDTNSITPSVPNGYFVRPKTFLGVSQFATAIGLSTMFSTPEILKKQIEEGYYSETTIAMSFGNAREDIARKHYEKIKKVKVTSANYKIFDCCHRLKGCCDGLIGKDGGLEIKCHYNYSYPLQRIPDYYLIQIAGYMILYDRKWFDFMSCCFDGAGNISDYNIIRVNRDEIENIWNDDWFPKFVVYVNSIKWHE